MDAKKDVHQQPQAVEIINKSDIVYAARGKKVVEINRKKSDATEAEILKLVLGPTGNLRAPTMRIGKKMVVGFNEDMYNSVLK